MRACCLLCLTVLICSSASAQLLPPANLTARAYERHIEVHWTRTTQSGVAGYRLYRENAGGTFDLIKSLALSDTLYLDWTGSADVSRRYTITARMSDGTESDTASSVGAKTFLMTDEQYLDMVQEYTFRYFWDFAHPVSGLARERNTSGETVTIGGSGFGVMGILVGIERGYITREEGLARLLKIVLFLENADRFHGIFPHWMNGTDGTVRPFSTLDNGGDIVESAFMFQGLLAVRKYFDGDGLDEIVLRHKITALWEDADWDWYRNTKNVILWHWSPENNFAINHEIRGWNEAQVVYLLAVASPTHPVSPMVYHTGWAGGNYTNNTPAYGYKLDVGSPTGGPLFFAHYSFLGFDPRYYRDAYANYFLQNQKHTLVNRAYCIANPRGHTGYSDVCWGLTASDDPLVGYLAHEPSANRDNGTITPTAALSSMPYTPFESIEALKHFYRVHGEKLWGPMGFYDAFNESENWVASSYLAIDQGPILGMIENYRSELLWNLFMQNEEIPEALLKMGFEPDSVSVGVPHLLPSDAVSVFPNPASSYCIVTNHHTSSLNLSLYSAHSGALISRRMLESGNQSTLDFSGLEAGMYILTGEDSIGHHVTYKVVHTSAE